MGVCEELATKLAAGGLGTVATNIFVGVMPETPDLCTALFEYAGLPPDRLFGNTVAAEDPRVQVLCRATTYSAARTRAKAVFDILSDLGAITLSGTRYHTMSALQSIFFLKRD